MKTFPDLVHRSLDAMFAIDGSQRVIFWNQACEDLTGVSGTQALGSSCHEVLQGHEPSGRPCCKANCPLGQLARGGPPPSNFAMRIAGKDGAKIQLNVATMLLPSPVDEGWMVAHALRRGHAKPPAGLHHPDGPVQRMGRESAQNKTDAHPSRGVHLMTEREREILRLLSHGLATDAISNQLHISVTTVRNHIQRLMAKLNVHSRIEAVTCAHRHHLV
ncbi:MAG TPA: helix-turn-helix transcriptional regulator [Thiobacillaceae bacterium]|nr:helix-turn-helix transcriptional regulator [Thiobacillaceae bacterium]